MRALPDAMRTRSAIATAPPALRRVLESFGVHGRDASLPLELRLSVVGDWVFSRFEGSGHIEMQRAPLSADTDGYRMLVIVTSGSVQTDSAAREPLAERRQAALYAFDRMPETLRFAGVLRNIVTIFPAPLLDTLEHGGPIATDRGAGLVLANVVRAVEAQAAFGDTGLDVVLPALATLIEAAFAAPEPAMPVPAGGRAAILLDFIESHLAEPGLTAAAVARLCGMSTRQLHRNFAATGETFADTLRRMRLEHAAALLADRRIMRRITDVANTVGFADPGYFATAFRVAYGCSPTQWRRGIG